MPNEKKVKATVAYCRSYDDGIYLTMVEGNVKGWFQTGTDYRAHALACAAQAAGKPVYVTYANYDPNWGDNAGHFGYVKLSLDLND